MEYKEQVKEEMEQGFKRKKYIIKILDLIEGKLFEMRALAQRVVDEELSD